MVELKLIKYFLNLVLVKATILVYTHYNISYFFWNLTLFMIVQEVLVVCWIYSVEDSFISFKDQKYCVM
jgi:hypothetical protein